MIKENNRRRKFLKIVGISALGLVRNPVITVYAVGEKFMPENRVSRTNKAQNAKRWGMVIDTRKLSDELNDKIIHACHFIHNVPDMKVKNHKIKWIWSEAFEHAFPEKEDEFLSDRLKHTPFLILCNHCENPACVRACPTKATFKREDGIVIMDFHRCIGCRFCMAACPYGSRSFNFQDPRPFIKKRNKKFPTRMKGVVEKCNFCAERLAEGNLPACVEVSEGAIVVGDLTDQQSEIRKLLKLNYTIRRNQSLGTGPSVYYIV